MKTTINKLIFKRMKTIKVKALLLSLVAVLTLGLTSCTDELGDNTQGQPGYLTLNLKTLKPKATKLAGANANDYKLLKDLNVFIFDGNTLILNKYYKDGIDGVSLTNDGAINNFSIKVGTLPGSAKVVVVANYGSRMTHINSLAALTSEEYTVIKDYSTTGLYMTGQAAITANGAFNYTSIVKVAPIMSKISVSWITSGDVDTYYDVTGVYIVNAVNKTKLPIIMNDLSNNTISSLLNPAIKTISTGLAGVDAKDYDLYNSTLDVANLCHTEPLAGTYSFYVGENYHKNLPAAHNAGDLYADDAANTANANTLIVIKTSPKSGVPAFITAMGDRYYTFDLNNSIASNAIDAVALTGYSTKRKTNYNVAFTLSDFGTPNPFERLNTLAVSVQSLGWDDQATPAGF